MSKNEDLDLEKIAEEVHNDLHRTKNHISQSSIKELLIGFSESDHQIKTKNLFNGAAIAQYRTGIVDNFLIEWFNSYTNGIDFKEDLFFGAVGGHGREELTPGSDFDTMLYVYNPTKEKTEFSLNLLLQIEEIEQKIPGLHGTVIRINDETFKKFRLEDYTTLLDTRYLAGNQSLSDEIESAYLFHINPLEFYLNLIGEGTKRHTSYPEDLMQLSNFNIKNGIGSLRDFQTASWLIGGDSFTPSTEIYRALPEELSNALNVLLKARAWLNLEYSGDYLNGKNSNSFPNNFKPEHFHDFEETFSRIGIMELISARKQAKIFMETTIAEKVRMGLRIDPDIMLFNEGLKIKSSKNSINENPIFKLFQYSQRYGIPIGKDNYFTEGMSELESSPEFLNLISESGILSTSLKTLNDYNALKELVPGWEYLEISTLSDHHWQKRKTRAQRAIERIENLETLITDSDDPKKKIEIFKEIHQNLDKETQLGLKLALMAKGIPKAIGIKYENYVPQFLEKYPELTEKTKEVFSFLMNPQNSEMLYSNANKYVLNQKIINRTKKQLSTQLQSQDPKSLKNILDALTVFTYSDRDFPAQQNLRSDQKNVLKLHYSTSDSLDENHTSRAFYRNRKLDPDDPTTPKILNSFPDRFVTSSHGDRIEIYGKKMLQWGNKKRPEIVYQKSDYAKNSFQLEVMSEDYSGLLWRTAGAIYQNQGNINHAEIYTMQKPTPDMLNFALNFFDISLPQDSSIDELVDGINKIISGRKKDISDLKDPGEIIQDTGFKDLRLREYDDDYILSITLKEDTPGVFYALTHILNEHLQANIHGFSVYQTKSNEIIDSIQFKSPLDLKYLQELSNEHLMLK